MFRRSFLMLAALPLIPHAVLAAGSSPLADAFAALGTDARRIALVEMQIAALYAGPVDATGSDEITEALQITADALVASGYDGPAMDVTTATGAMAFVTALSKGDLSAWLYGEGNEMDG